MLDCNLPQCQLMSRRRRKSCDVSSQFLYIIKFTLFSSLFQGFQCLTSHRVECNQIEDGHKTNAYVTEIPYCGVSCKSSDEEHYKSHDFVGSLVTPFISEQVGYVGAGIEQNSNESGKTEHCQSSCNKDCSKCSKVVLHSKSAADPCRQVRW